MTIEPFNTNEIFKLIMVSVFAAIVVYQQYKLAKDHPELIGSKFYFYSIVLGFLLISFFLALFCYVQKTISVAIIFLIATYLSIFCWAFWNHFKNRDKTK